MSLDDRRDLTEILQRIIAPSVSSTAVGIEERRESIHYYRERKLKNSVVWLENGRESARKLLKTVIGAWEGRPGYLYKIRKFDGNFQRCLVTIMPFMFSII